jgi:hypothetical protein
VKRIFLDTLWDVFGSPFNMLTARRFLKNEAHPCKNKYVHQVVAALISLWIVGAEI